MRPVARDRVRNVLDERVADREASERPVFYAIVGSHAHGTAVPGSDVDVRGFHVAPAREHVRVTHPPDRYAVDPNDLDLVSHELRAFGRLLRDGDLNAVETALSPHDLVDRDDVQDLRALVRDALPLDVPRRYAGMARSNFMQATADGDPKAYLHAVRGLLAAVYVREHGDLVLDVHDLSKAVLGDDDLVSALVDAKRNGALSPELAETADDVVEDLFDRVPEECPGVEKAAFETEIDRWMFDVRETVTA